MPCTLSNVNTLTDFATIEPFNNVSTEGRMPCNLSNLNPITDYAKNEPLDHVSHQKVASEFEMPFVKSNTQLKKIMLYILSVGTIFLTYNIYYTEKQ